MTNLPPKLAAIALVITVFLAILGGGATTALLEDDEVANASIETGNVGGITVGNTHTNDVCAGNVDDEQCTNSANLGSINPQPFSPQVEPAANGG